MDAFPDKENLDEVYENNDYDDEDDDHTFDVPWWKMGSGGVTQPSGFRPSGYDSDVENLERKWQQGLVSSIIMSKVLPYLCALICGEDCATKNLSRKNWQHHTKTIFKLN